MTPRFSPGGKRLPFVMGRVGRRELWVHDLERGATSRLTPQFVGIWLVWTPDGVNIIFTDVSRGVYWVRADGAGKRNF
jgi:Tol biopolymer transport system component